MSTAVAVPMRLLCCCSTISNLPFQPVVRSQAESVDLLEAPAPGLVRELSRDVVGTDPDTGAQVRPGCALNTVTPFPPASPCGDTLGLHVPNPRVPRPQNPKKSCPPEPSYSQASP